MAIDISTVCLGLLSLGDATGYEIKKNLEEGQMRHFLDASYGAIYPALARLDNEGLVDCRLESQSGRPDRKVYSITPKGHSQFVNALDVTPAPDRTRSDFMFLMLFSELIDRERIKDLIDARLESYQARIAEIDANAEDIDTPGMQFAASHGRAVYTAAIEHLKTHRHLLEHAPNPSDARVDGEARAEV